MTNFIKTSLITLVSFFITFVAIEIIVRTFDLGPKPLAPLPVPTYQLSKNPVLRYEFRPNYKSTETPFDRSHKGYETNKEGFRDYNYTIEKPNNIRRIIVLGDSTTAGNGVPDMDKVYPKRLEQLLNADDNGIKSEVLNMGTGGYHTVQEVEALKDKGLKYSPDLVMVLFCLNDFNASSDGGVYKSLLRVNMGKGVSLQRPFSRFLMDNSRFIFWLYTRTWAHLTKNTPDSPDTWYETNVLRGKTTVEVGFEMLADIKQKSNFETLFLILPGFDAPFDSYRYGAIHQRVREIGKKFPSVPVMDLTPYFQRVNNGARVFSYDGLHMNPYGHDTLARILFNTIRESTHVK